MDLDELKELLQILEEKEITEFELEEQGKKLRIVKAASNHAAPTTVIAAPLVSAAIPSVSHVAAASGPVPVPAPAAAPVPAPSEVEADLLVVKSPIVGTFYRSPDPNSAAFVDVGDRIRPGQVLCIVEAMKLMNEIEAEVSGQVVKVHPQSGQPVQYGDPLFSVRPD